MSNLTREDTVLTIQGTEIPRLGFGTWQITGKDATEGVRDALEIGYRHIDTARAYENEAEVGAGDRGERRRPRRHLAHHQDLARGLRAREAQARRRGLAAQARTDYVDLLLLHWPSTDVPLEHSLEAMRELQEAGGSATPACRTSRPGCWRARSTSSRCSPTRSSTTRCSAQDALLGARARARPHADRVLPARPRQGRRPPRADRDRRAVRQERRPGRAALAARPAERDDGAEGVEPRAPAGELRGLRLRAQRRRPRGGSPRCRRTSARRTPRGRRTGTAS